MAEEAHSIPGVQEAHRIPGVQKGDKADKMAARTRILDARTLTANDAATPPDIKAGMVSLQQAQADHRSGLMGQSNKN